MSLLRFANMHHPRFPRFGGIGRERVHAIDRGRQTVRREEVANLCRAEGHGAWNGGATVSH